MNRGIEKEQRQRGPAAAYMEICIPDEWNAKTERIIGLAMRIHRELGPGLLERIYEEALAYELSRNGFKIARQHVVRLRYQGIELGEQHLDFVVDDLIVLELKAVEKVSDLHLAQLVSYLNAGKFPLGLVINFNELLLKNGVYRRINPSACPKRSLPSPSSSSPSPSSSVPSVPL